MRSGFSLKPSEPFKKLCVFLWIITNRWRLRQLVTTWQNLEQTPKDFCFDPFSLWHFVTLLWANLITKSVIEPQWITRRLKHIRMCAWSGNCQIGKTKRPLCSSKRIPKKIKMRLNCFKPTTPKKSALSGCKKKGRKQDKSRRKVNSPAFTIQRSLNSNKSYRSSGRLRTTRIF